MKYRTLGQGLKVSAIGLGCMTMFNGGNIIYGADMDPDEGVKTVHKAIDLGVTFFDTAEIYGPYINEERLAAAIKGKRDGLIIATKFGFKIANGGIAGFDSSPANARRAVDASLKRLGTDYIDLFYQHRVDAQTPIEDTVGALADLVKEGKIKHIGLSEAGPETIRRAAKVAPITALQSEYSLWERDPEDGILEACRENGIGFVPYSPLGRGFLSGQLRSRADLAASDWRLGDPRFSEENFDQNLAIVDAVAAIAGRHGVSTAQIALAWLMAQGDDVVPIPGTKRRVTMEDCVASVEVELSAEDLATISAIKPPAGLRYSAAGLAVVRA